MGIKRLLENLKDYLDKGYRKSKVHCARIDTILEKLAEKEHKLHKKLDKESSPGRRKRLKAELKILSAQRKKGLKRRKELKDKCR